MQMDVQAVLDALAEPSVASLPSSAIFLDDNQHDASVPESAIF